jgi:hypothetical protein
MPSCRKCGAYTKYRNGLCYSCYNRNKSQGSSPIIFINNPPPDNRPRHIITETREEWVKRNRRDFKILFLWFLPLIVLGLSLWLIIIIKPEGRLQDKTISEGYTTLAISILWLLGSLYLRKKRGKWI